MIDNHKTAYSPPGAAVEQILADLSAKRAKEQAKRFELETLLAESRTRESNLEITIASLRNEYGITDELTQVIEPQTQETDSAAQTKQVIFKRLGTLYTHTSKRVTEKPNWKKPTSKTWLEIVREAIRHFDRFIPMQSIFEYYGMNEKAQEDYYNTLTSTLSAYKSSGHLVGIPVYKKTVTGRTITRIMWGLPEYLIDIDGEALKPVYEEQLNELVSQSDYSRTVEEAKQA